MVPWHVFDRAYVDLIIVWILRTDPIAATVSERLQDHKRPSLSRAHGRHAVESAEQISQPFDCTSGAAGSAVTSRLPERQSVLFVV